MTKALSPTEVEIQSKQFRRDRIPPEVVQVVNDMLIEEYGTGGVVTLLQKDIIARVREVTGLTNDTIYARKFMDFEDVFRAAGWKVVYDKPSYNEDYEANFKFSKNSG